MRKNCIICKKEFTKPYNESRRLFRERHKFCSLSCKYLWNSQINKEIGWQPPLWPRGKKKPPRTAEHKEKLGRYRRNKTYEEIYGVEKAQKIKEKLSKAFDGEKNHRWRGGCKTGRILRASKPYIRWRKMIYKRDGYICQICGNEAGGRLRSHHIKKFSDYPELRLEPINGITICDKCDIRWVLHREREWESYFNFNLINRRILVDNYFYIAT